MAPLFTRPLRPRVLACGLACLLTGCGDDPSAPPPPGDPPSSPAWSEITSMPPSFTAYALWAPAPDYVIAVGPRGQVHRWDSQRWAAVETETGKDLFSIAGDGAGPVVAVGNDGVTLRVAGTRFVVVPTPTTEHLRGVWMAARDDFFIVGNAGTILRGDGNAWSAMNSGTTTPLYSVWGAAHDDVFAAGMNGVILHWDGASWSAMDSGTREILAAIHGTGPSDAYAAGDHGTILHWDGAAWAAMNSGTSALLQSVCATGTPIVVGASGAVLSLDEGGAWRPHAGIADAWLYAVARAGEHTWVAGTNAVLLHDGAAWQSPTRGAVPVLRAVVVESGTSDLLVGGDDTYLAHGRDGAWHVEEGVDARVIRDLWESEDGELFAVGTNRILRRNGAEWIVESAEVAEFHDIDGSDGAVFAVGSEGRIRLRTALGWKGSAPITAANLHGVAVRSGEEAYAVGENGWIAKYNGAAWMSMVSHTSADLHDVIIVPGSDPPRAIAVGDEGVIRGLLVPPGQWFEMPGPTTAALYALAFGPGGDLYAAGGGGTVLRLRGTAWEIVPAPTGRTLLAAGSRNGTLFVAGGDEVGGAVLLRLGPSR